MRLVDVVGEPAGPEEQLLDLRRRFPGWQIWYVPYEPDGGTWCARPQILIRCGSAEDLAASIGAAHDEVIPESVALASSRDYATRVRRLREQQEAAGAAWRRRKARSAPPEPYGQRKTFRPGVA
jgi:hypothetical protein